MQKKEMAAGLLIAALLIGTLGFMAQQQLVINQLQAEIGEVIPINNREWGATIYMRIYRSGVLLSEEAYHNVITNAARTALRGHIGDTAVAVWDYLAIGTGSGGGVGSTTLVTETHRDQGTYATVGSYNFTIDYTWGAGNFSGQTITECGVLNAAAAGTLLNYDDSFSRGPLQSTDSLQVTVNFQVGS
ncbi:MAG: hypothetical protein ACYTDW_06120 [Planctomycetota bacterium]|jgi:hypothetical protein